MSDLLRIFNQLVWLSLPDSALATPQRIRRQTQESAVLDEEPRGRDHVAGHESLQRLAGRCLLVKKGEKYSEFYFFFVLKKKGRVHKFEGSQSSQLSR